MPRSYSLRADTRRPHPKYDTEVPYSLMESWINGNFSEVMSTLKKVHGALGRLYVAEFMLLMEKTAPEDTNRFLKMLRDAL